MKRLFVSCLWILGWGMHAHAQSVKGLRDGDLLFQNLDCGGMCDAIEAVTQGYEGRSFSHVGIVHLSGDSVRVIEAIGERVQDVSLAHFRSRNKNTVWVGRLKQGNAEMGKNVVQYALRQIGKPYDGLFRMNDSAYYCSELVYDAYASANRGHAVFPLNPMTFREPGSQQFFPVWEQYFKELGQKPPEGAPGINPGGISRSDKLNLFPLQ